MIKKDEILQYLQEINFLGGEPGKTCEKLLHLFRKVIDYEGWAIFILNDNLEQFELVKAHNFHHRYIEEIEGLMEEGVVDWILDKGVPTFLPSQESIDVLQKRLLAVPFKVGKNRKVGIVFVLCSENQSFFEESILKLLTFLAGQTALIIDNYLLSRRLSRQREEQYIFSKVYEGVESNKELKDILKPILKLALMATQSQFGFLLKVDQRREKLSPWVSLNIPLSKIKGCHFSLNKGAMSYVISTGKPLIVDDYDKDIRFKNCGEFNGFKPKNLISVPLKIRKDKLGVLTLCDTVEKKPFYTRDDLNFLLVMASYTTVIIKNKLLYNDLRKSFLSTIEALVQAIEAKDSYTSGHSRRVTKYSLEIGRYLGLSSKEMEMIRFCGLLHDIGKIGISDNLLNKPSRLSKREYETIKKHPVIGKKIVEKVKFLKEGLALIYHHHERYDGKGYPDGLKGGEIPLLARILSVADAFDAMVSERPYRRALTVQEAIKELINGSGTQFDPLITRIFCLILKRKFQSKKFSAKFDREKLFGKLKGKFRKRAQK